MFSNGFHDAPMSTGHTGNIAGSTLRLQEAACISKSFFTCSERRRRQSLGPKYTPDPRTCRAVRCRSHCRYPPTSGPSASSNNKAVLEDVVKAIDAVARPNGPPLSSATPTTVPVAAAPTPAAASLAPPATATSTSTPTAASTNQRTAVGHGGAAVSEANGVLRQRPRFTDTTRVGAAGGGGGGVEGSRGGKVSGAIADASAGLSRPSGRVTTTNDVLAAAAEVNGAAGDSAREAARLSGDVKAAASAGGSVVEAPTGEESPVVVAVAAGPSENSLGIDGVAVEPGAPPASMAEVR